MSEPFVSDSPVTDPNLDKFKRLPFAKRIAETLAQRRDSTSIVVVIHGEWGEGKTTVLEFVYGALCRFDDILPIRFNPWRFSDELSLLMSFFATLAGTLDKSPKTAKEKLGDVFRSYGDVLGEIAIEANGTKVSVGHSVSKMGEKLSMVTIEERKDRIERMLKASRKRLVVFLDDIDRLERKEIQSVFKLLKLTADFAYVSYVLAFDRDVVAAAIGEQYGAGDIRAGYQYLEKVVQVNLNLPIADRELLYQLCIEGVNDALRMAKVSLSQEQERGFQLAFLQYVVPELRNPRLAKLYANSVAFALPLLAHEVNPVDLLLLEAIKFAYPAIHEDIRKFPSVYTGEFGWDLSGVVDRGRDTRQRLDEMLNKMDVARAGRARHLLTELFPQLHNVFRANNYGDRNEDQARREQRVWSLDYLRRYLTCSIPAGDVSDQQIDDFLRGIGSFSDDEVGVQFRSLARPDEHRKLLFKLKSRIEQIPLDSAVRLCFTIAREGPLFSVGSDELGQPWEIAGLLIRLVLQRMQRDSRKEFALKILDNADPLPFAAEYLGWMRPQRNEAEADYLFSSADMEELVQVLAERISRDAKRAPLICSRPQDFPRLLTIWKQGKGSSEVKEYVGRALCADPSVAADLIRPFSSFARTGNEGVDQEGYESLIALVDPEDLMKAFAAAGLLKPERAEGVARLAQQFAALHRNARRPENPKDTPGSNERSDGPMESG